MDNYEKVKEYLLRMGVRADLSGFEYITQTIAHIMDNGGSPKSYKTAIESIMEQRGVKSYAYVCKPIHYVINNGLNRADELELIKLFGENYYKAKPKDFCVTVANKLLNTHKTMSNGDYIRQQSDDKLVDVLDFEMYCTNQAFEECVKAHHSLNDVTAEECGQCALRWLRSEWKGEA